MSKENGLRDLICPNGCGGTEFDRWTETVESIRQTLVAFSCMRCGYTFYTDEDTTNTYDEQLEDMRRVNNAGN